MINICDIVIRRACLSDSAILTDISFAAKRYWKYPESYYNIWKDELTIDENYILKNIVYIATVKDVPAGYYSIVENRQDITVGPVFVGKGFWMEHIFISPQYMFQGIGSQLINHMKSLCADMQIDRIKIFVDPNAAGFYEKAGAKFKYMSESSIEGREIPVFEMDI